MWHTNEDNSVPAMNTYLYAQGLLEHKVDHECHTFHKGKHGLSLANEQSAKDMSEAYRLPHVAGWFSMAIEWLKEQ